MAFIKTLVSWARPVPSADNDCKSVVVECHSCLSKDPVLFDVMDGEACPLLAQENPGALAGATGVEGQSHAYAATPFYLVHVPEFARFTILAVVSVDPAALAALAPLAPRLWEAFT
jgi:hypothetical protein